MIVHVLKIGVLLKIKDTKGEDEDMTPWHAYLIDVYIICKALIAVTCIPIGVIQTCVGLDVSDSNRITWGLLLAFLGLAIPLLLPTRAILIKLLEW